MTEKEKTITELIRVREELIRVRDGFTPDPYMTLEDDISVFANALIYIINTLEEINDNSFTKSLRKMMSKAGEYIEKDN